MRTENRLVTTLLDMIVDGLDIPKSYYEKAVERHRSLGEWLCRPESKLAAFRPYVYPQGSFRYGTVIRPLLATEAYDLDNVTTLKIAKTAMTQQQIKQLYGAEIKEYARAHGMLAPVEEKNRCWRLAYADEVNFYLDTLPCVPEDQDVIRVIVSRGVPLHLAALAVAITDRRHPQYDQITRALRSSNPRGFAAWFEERARPSAFGRMRHLVDLGFYDSVENVPLYEWKTPLQRSIQVLKRHRDVMFRDDPGTGPISMVITNLAAHAYAEESDLWSALRNIIETMPQYVNSTRPRVPNPADPAEDYADKWAMDPTLEDNFWAWHAQVKVDVDRLPALIMGRSLVADVRRIFRADLTQDQLEQLEAHKAPSMPAIVRSAAVLQIPTAPRPWGDHT